jgi:hypothetical protein
MEPFVIQNLRYKLQKRVSRLNGADREDSFKIALGHFWRFFDQQPMFVGIVESLRAQFPEAEKAAERIFAQEPIYGVSEEEAAAIGHCVLRRLPEPELSFVELGYLYRRTAKQDECLEVIREFFLTPFYEYVDEQLDDRRAMLSLLMRYKHRSEWFHRKYLWELSKAERRGEKQLAMDLYSYLHDQGIDFMIEPSSITDEVDLIVAQNTQDPLLLDAKIFDGDARGKHYIRKGFNQIYTYTQQYNEPFGYLVIYKTAGKDLRFSLRTSTEFPYVVHNHKTIFLIVIDIFPHPKPVSQRGTLGAVEIAEEELVSILTEEAAGSGEPQKGHE